MLGAICMSALQMTLQIGSTPNYPRCWSM